ncbi:uncharacterized protein A1O9_10501 [Exophiala aquamarina CBS 119918]|uniref:Cation/H+ exchanger transmembrane domain-containing protein n=1 Tax=Exophiala aquamarina CBS 119918 TaxID=1182545 RepID=A0A072P0Z7_9EURO|nr:uncharacterized protein A1O9_10501 [Exophiala aquamarina CBS 119918]KEF53526.1 hypothetical protein A1O9_10501 [Exophiala aquamarina CBS 119918]
MSEAALSYHEPGIILILVQSSFLIVLNVAGATVDYYLYCGLIAQVLLGMGWGAPGAALLSNDFQEVATQLGYLGLIAIIFEGGLSTSVKAVQQNLILSICVALTGILLPVGFSYSLCALASASNLQAFAAGAALCSTSLGTTFNLLKTTDMTSTRLGVVLTSAAMLDDVVGLIMVQVISNLGSGPNSFKAISVVRPVFVSFGFAVVLILICKYACKPIMNHISMPQMARSLLAKPVAYFLGCTVFLLALITSASYAGTSVLFAAYLAGASISWLDANQTRSKNHPGENLNVRQQPPDNPTAAFKKGKLVPDVNKQGRSEREEDVDEVKEVSNEQLPSADFQQPPARQEPTPPPEGAEPETTTNPGILPGSVELHSLKRGQVENSSRSLRMYNDYYAPSVERLLKPFFFASIGFSIPITKMCRGPVLWRGVTYAIIMAFGKLSCGLWLLRLSKLSNNPSGTTEKKRTAVSVMRPISMYPASILGSAMIARGEIGFLISALAATNGIFNGENKDADAPANESEIFLVVTWGILLCTVAGPLALGLLMRRVRRLQQKGPGPDGGKEDPLGIWAVD